MTNEIKEILDELESMSEISELEEQVNNISKIGDCITNLQNEIFDLKDTIQNKNDCIGAYECIIEDRDKRIDKAVEYINKYEYQRYCPSAYENDKYIMREEKEGKDLLDILRGDE